MLNSCELLPKIQSAFQTDVCFMNPVFIHLCTQVCTVEGYTFQLPLNYLGM